MNKVIVEDRMPQFKTKSKIVLNDAIREAAVNTLIKAKRQVPYKKNGLQTDSLTRMVAPLLWRVEFNKEYARFQEFGGDGKRKVRNYTTPGTGKHYLKRAGDEQMDKLRNIFKKHSSRIK